MRSVRYTILPLMVLMVLVSSCAKDDDPKVAVRDDYLGLWQCEEYDTNQQLIATFQIEIIAHPSDANRILIDNFTQLGLGFQVEAIISNTSLEIPPQFVSSAEVSGSGFITNAYTGLELQYTFDDGSGQPETITATCTKL